MESLHGSRRMSRRLLVFGIAIAAIGAVAIIQGARDLAPPPHPSAAAARAYLDEIARLAAKKDWNGLCELGDLNCTRILGPLKAVAPSVPPVLLSSADVPDVANGTGFRQGGRLLKVCGLDAAGKPYTSELLVFESDGRLISIDPVFWAGLTIGVSATPISEPASVPGGAPVQGCPSA